MTRTATRSAQEADWIWAAGVCDAALRVQPHIVEGKLRSIVMRAGSVDVDTGNELVRILGGWYSRERQVYLVRAEFQRQVCFILMRYVRNWRLREAVTIVTQFRLIQRINRPHDSQRELFAKEFASAGFGRARLR